MNNQKFLYLALVAAVLLGCQTSKPQGPTVTGQTVQDKQQAQSALKAVAGAIAGQNVSPQQMQHLTTSLQKDKDAQTAVQAITGSMEGDTGAVKYCPIDGKRYAPHVKVCPVHGVPLKTLEE